MYSYNRLRIDSVDRQLKLSDDYTPGLYLDIDYDDVIFVKEATDRRILVCYQEPNSISKNVCSKVNIIDVFKELKSFGFKQISRYSSVLVNTNKINFMSFTMKNELNLVFHTHTVIDGDTVRLDSINKLSLTTDHIYNFSLLTGLFIALEDSCTIKELKQYKVYIKKFAEKYSDQLLLYELNWRAECHFDYSVFLN